MGRSPKLEQQSCWTEPRTFGDEALEMGFEVKAFEEVVDQAAAAPVARFAERVLRIAIGGLLRIWRVSPDAALSTPTGLMKKPSRRRIRQRTRELRHAIGAMDFVASGDTAYAHQGLGALLPLDKKKTLLLAHSDPPGEAGPVRLGEDDLHRTD